MDYEEQGRVTQFLAGLALGAVIGAGLALLTAPDSGRKTRRRIRRAASDVREQAGDRFGVVSEGVRDRVGDAIGVARKRLRRG